MNQQREKTCSREKAFFRGVWIFFKFQGGLTKKCVCVEAGGVDQHSSFGGIALCRGDKFFQGDGA